MSLASTTSLLHQELAYVAPIAVILYISDCKGNAHDGRLRVERRLAMSILGPCCPQLSLCNHSIIPIFDIYKKCPKSQHALDAIVTLGLSQSETLGRGVSKSRL